MQFKHSNSNIWPFRDCMSNFILSCFSFFVWWIYIWLQTNSAYEEFIWIIQQPSHNTVVTTSCYLLRDILSCGSLFGIVHLLLRSPIRNRWKIFIPGIGFVILAAFLFFVVPSIDHIRLYMEFIPMEIISLDLLVILVLQKNLKEAYSWSKENFQMNMVGTYCLTVCNNFRNTVSATGFVFYSRAAIYSPLNAL